ncbi:MAG: glycosyltransferase [Pseudoflavonifractor sp.]|nr:glycosyltransferase [Pseudoflavonifractor sp.]
MADTPLISIIIPVHNVAPYLRRCIESVRNQDIRDIEIILVENLSTDNSPEICREYAATDLRIKVLTIDTAGPSIARNSGLDIATAPYIGFIDSDDWIDPEMYSTMLREMQRHDAQSAYCNFMLDYDDGTSKSVFPDTGAVTVLDTKAAQRDIIMERSTSSPCVRLYQRDFFKSHRFPVGKFFEDHATLYRWIADCNRIVHIDSPFYHYFMRADSTCHSVQSSPQKAIDIFYAEYDRLAYIEANDIFSGDELIDARTHIIKQSVSHMRNYLSSTRAPMGDNELKKMREAILKCLRYSKDEIRPRTYNKLRRIAYFWPLYYLSHRKRK